MNLSDDVSQKAKALLSAPDEPLERARKKLAAAPGGRFSGLLDRWSLLVEYLNSPRVPAQNKLFIAAAVLYVLSPLDLMPGPLDDLVVGVFLARYVNRQLDEFEAGGDLEDEAPLASENPFLPKPSDAGRVVGAPPRRNPFLPD